jgi:hypothetical protein
VEKLIVNFGRNPKGLDDRVRIVSLLERRGIGFEWEKTEEPQINQCPKCGSNAYRNDDCDNCIRNSVGEVFYE